MVTRYLVGIYLYHGYGIVWIMDLTWCTVFIVVDPYFSELYLHLVQIVSSDLRSISLDAMYYPDDILLYTYCYILLYIGVRGQKLDAQLSSNYLHGEIQFYWKRLQIYSDRERYVVWRVYRYIQRETDSVTCVELLRHN